MTSSSEIHVQEVLNNLSNTIKRDAEIVDGSSFTAAIAQQDATALPTSLAAELPVTLPTELSTALAAELPAALPVTIATSIPSQEQHQIGQEQLERIAQQHQQEQAQLAQAQAEQDAHVHAQVQAVQAQVQAHVQAQVAQAAQAQQAQEQVQPLQEALVEDNHVIHVNALDSNNSSTLATVPITSVASAVPPPAKPAPGSEEWHRIRRDNHKEVERRRRENINHGINDLAAVIPNSDKNKGAILRQAVQYIQTIQEAQVKMMEEAQNVEAVKFEREQALVAKNLAQAELQNLIAQHAELKRNYDALRKEVDDAEEAKKKQRPADEE
ncbi:basic helix-loop-helix protein [Linnemannia schmuckeri]|uniref:Basic helix-loop-helix protein n=1 Tax=Linnemannia schmuckeri TaxID=64567 RepID=A0A9P5S4Q6_9FUNG|nr:basic helix-loop-helix protein [Linnemannia schmuckeri]